jgi:hypothetical protein
MSPFKMQFHSFAAANTSLLPLDSLLDKEERKILASSIG